jgi:membrane-associated phospholipid phosphatase
MGPLVRCFTLLCLLGVSAGAQPPTTETRASLLARIGRHTGNGFTTLVRDHALLWSSPFRGGRAALRTTVPIAAATAFALTLDQPIVRRLPNTPDQVRYAKYVSASGTYYTLGAAAGAFVGVGAIAHNRRAIETGLLAAQAIAHTESIAQMLKFAGGRERPDYGEGHHGRFWRGQQSFPSGHAMGTWAVATIVSREYHQNRWLRYGVYAFPIAVSASRMGANRHFLSDVVAGGSLGYLIGGFLYNRHHDSTLGGAPVRGRGIAIRPDVQFDPKTRSVGVALHISR